MDDKPEDVSEVTYSYSLEFGGKIAVIGIWAFLILTIVIGAIGDLLAWKLLVNIAIIMATTFMLVASVAISILALIGFIMLITFIFGKVKVNRAKKH
jgi:hypothetical protein